MKFLVVASFLITSLIYSSDDQQVPSLTSAQLQAMEDLTQWSSSATKTMHILKESSQNPKWYIPQSQREDIEKLLLEMQKGFAAAGAAQNRIIQILHSDLKLKT